ncbi:hypothetical protein FACS1894179_04450 [Bacteroidia bacterium]|nr:hypothetical protein FACS1894179_04450 [Bacteroidia bacterium]
MTFSSCENAFESEIPSQEEIMTITKSKTAIIDSLEFEDVLVLEETEEQKALFEKIKKLQRLKASTYAYGDDYDEYFSTNMWAIRELPFSLQARGGGNTGNRYLTTNGKRKEVTLTSSAYSNAQKFYVKVLPASTGIPYILYSQQERTPLVVGYWSNDPNRKMLMPDDKDQISYYTSWDFISTSYRGYYAVQNTSYIGQANPNDPWSIFYHVLEVKNNNVVGYNRYTNQASQEFLLKPDAYFSLKKVEFVNPYSAKVTQRDNFVVEQAYTNASPQSRRINMEFDRTVSENSYFKEKNTIAFNMYNSSIQFARPNVTLGKIDLTPNMTVEKNTFYKPNLYQYIDKKLYNLVPVVVKPYHKLIMYYPYKVYDVECDFIATITYNDREAKIAGRWSGKLYIDEIFEPEYEEIDLNSNRSVRGKVNVKNATQSSPVTF